MLGRKIGAQIWTFLRTFGFLRPALAPQPHKVRKFRVWADQNSETYEEELKL